jgi:energy-coupling factor transporter ATP-binding protein EcfA2
MIPFILDEDLLKAGDSTPIEWNYETSPHVVIFGPTGSGKSYCCKLLLGKISLYIPDSMIYVCDFKRSDDFAFLKDCERFYVYTDCADGLNIFYSRFIARQSGEDTSRSMSALYFDEWAAYLNSIQDKKQLESEKQKLANILMLGRSFNVHIVLSQQRVDAQYFSTARDNFNIVLGLSNLSIESRDMFFSSFKKEIRPDRARGTGYMLTNGANLTRVVVPKINNMDKLHEVIKQGVTRN